MTIQPPTQQLPTQHPDDLPLLVSEEDVLARITTLVGPAITDGQLWLMFVDGDGRQAPVVVPISRMPRHPDRRGLAALTKVLGGVARGLATSCGPGAVILTRERTGGAGALPLDHVWAEALAEACRAADLPLRGLYLSTAGGVARLR